MVQSPSLDDALESVAVAVGLGMDIPAVQGLTIYSGSLQPSSDSLGSDYETPPCNTAEAVTAHLVNEALRQLINECDDVTDTDRILHGRETKYSTLTDYAVHATNEQILSDYKKFLTADVYTWQTTVNGDVPNRVPPEDLNCWDGQHLPPAS